MYCRIAVCTVALSSLLLVFPDAAAAQSSDSPLDVRTRVEVGFLDPLSHQIQFGKDGTEIDYIEEGGQDVLFPFVRATVEARVAERHRITALYQPLNLEGQVVTDRTWTLEETTFPEGTVVDTKYGFPFYRLGYAYDVLADSERELELGAALQLRNATIEFTSADGSVRKAERDVGPVPVLSARLRLPTFDGQWFEFDVDGFYAPIKYINGSDNDVIGAIVDASLRYGFDLDEQFDTFLNFRYLAGGAEGSSGEEIGEDFTRNWLHFATVSLGFTFDI